MSVGAAVAYNEGIWLFSYTYRAVLVTWRAGELAFFVLRYLFLRAPLMVVWTRLPGLRRMRAPYPGLAEILSPTRDRASLLISQAEVTFGARTVEFIKTFEDAEGILAEVKEKVKPLPWWRILVGGLVRGLIVDMGSTFMKLGQIMSMRPEIPPFLREELQRIQDRLPPLKPDEVRAILERELMKPVETVFEWVEYEPVASASLASVYHAKLKTGSQRGKEVALKIQRPHLNGVVKLDTILIVDILLPIVQRVLPSLRKSDLSIFTASFQECLRKEIDFVLEARIQDRIRSDMLSHPVYAKHIKIAEVYFDYTTPKVLAMEFVPDFVRMDRLLDDLTLDEAWEVINIKVEGYPEDVPLHIYLVGGNWLGLMLFDSELFHGDLHLGNMYVQRPQVEGDVWKFFVCDFGMFQDWPVDSPWRTSIKDLIKGLMDGDSDLTLEVIQKMHLSSGGKLKDVDWEDLHANLTNLVRRRMVMESPDKISVRGIPYPGAKSLTQEAIQTLLGYAMRGLRLPFQLWLVLKSLCYIEEIGMTFWGGMDYSSIFEPFFLGGARTEMSSKLAKTNVFDIEESVPALVEGFPKLRQHKVLQAVQEAMKKGQVQKPSLVQGGIE